jgi:oligoendopeptidase F
MLESFSKKLNDLERDTSNVKLYEERMNDKDMKLRDSTRKADKLTTINKTLTKELKDASLKIMQLEKEMQVVVCSQLQEHRSKLKESAYMNK